MLWFLYNFLYVLLYDFLYEAILFTFLLLIFLSFLIVFLSSPFPSPTHLPILPLFLPGQIKMASPLNSQPKDCHSSYQEKPWTATVGEEKKVFYIHPFVLCKASSVFEARVRGSWKNTSEGTLDWSQFTEETIECVLEYLYMGKYTPHKRPRDGHEAPGPPPSNDGSQPGSDAADATNTLGERILMHAQVHSFATEYLVHGLEQYAILCMESCFAEEEKVSPQILPHLLQSIEHIYENTPSSQAVTNRVREAVCDFVADNYFVLIPDAAANPLAEANGSFLADLSYHLARMAFVNMSTHEDPKEKEFELYTLQNAYNRMKVEIERLQEDLAATSQEIRELQKGKRRG